MSARVIIRLISMGAILNIFGLMEISGQNHIYLTDGKQLNVSVVKTSNKHILYQYLQGGKPKKVKKKKVSMIHHENGDCEVYKLGESRIISPIPGYCQILTDRYQLVPGKNFQHVGQSVRYHPPHESTFAELSSMNVLAVLFENTAPMLLTSVQRVSHALYDARPANVPPPPGRLNDLSEKPSSDETKEPEELLTNERPRLQR